MPAQQNSKPSGPIPTIDVLIFDDDPDDIRIVTQALKKASDINANCTSVNCYADFSALSLEDFDVMLIDNFLGEIEGSSLIDEQHLHEKLPVILLSDKLNPTLEQTCFEHSQIDCMGKDEITSSSIGRRIRATMRHHDYQQRMNYAAYHDELTKLYSRSYWEHVLGQALNHADRNQEPLAIMVADIDDFKTINDNYGHPVGDKVLNAVAEILVQSVRSYDTVARIGGDEFALLLESMSKTRIQAICEKIHHACHYLHLQLNIKHPVTVSIGVGLVNTFLLPDIVYKNADDALYIAKRKGKACYHINEMCFKLR